MAEHLGVTGKIPDSNLYDGDEIVYEPRKIVRGGLAAIRFVKSDTYALRYVKYQGRKVTLTPFNELYPCGTFDRSAIEVLGVVTAVIRQF